MTPTPEIRFLILAVGAGALLLAACEPAPAPASIPAAPEPATPPAAALASGMMGGVALSQPIRALGTEPFWGVDISPSGLTYSGVDRPAQTATHTGPALQGAVAVWSGRTDQGNELEVVLTATECSDGMSDRVYPLSARVRIGTETLTGCAASTAAIMSAGESGPVIETPQ